jgi:hypothetical protein
VFLYAFDLIELDGADLRRDPLAVRKVTLASLLARAAPGLRFNEHLDEADGPLVFRTRGHGDCNVPVTADALARYPLHSAYILSNFNIAAPGHTSN